MSTNRATIDCICCLLPQLVAYPAGYPPAMCSTCMKHRGEDEHRQLLRALSHEAMLRERLSACRASEARAKEAERAAKGAAIAAFRSRADLARRILNVANERGDVGVFTGDRKLVEWVRRDDEANGYVDHDWSDEESAFAPEGRPRFVRRRF